MPGPSGEVRWARAVNLEVGHGPPFSKTPTDPWCISDRSLIVVLVQIDQLKVFACAWP